MFRDKELVGMANISLKQKIFKHVGDAGITIKKECRGESLGGYLMKEVLEKSYDLRGIKKVTLSVFKNNTSAIKLYKKLGFKEYGCLPKAIKWRGKYIDEILMYKDLKK